MANNVTLGGLSSHKTRQILQFVTELDAPSNRKFIIDDLQETTCKDNQ
ncbi:hypothetical protein ENHY17A_100115 [Moraxellaceae bacterium 17A]|nr:hypothetical protein ENHY17A_100115 [Moraxellaceae bacterium 17A]